MLAEYFASQQKMVVKNTKTKTKKFNYNKNETMIKMFNHLRAGIRIRKTRKMVKEQNTVSSMSKVMRSKVNIPPIKTHSPMKKRMETHSPMKKRIKTHSPMKTVKYNLSKGFKWSKVEQGGARLSKVGKSKNRVCREQNLVNNHENKMDNR